MKRTATTLVVLLTLTGCQEPNTQQAYTNCYEALYEAYKHDAAYQSDSFDRKNDMLEAFYEKCSEDAKADPVAFNDKWG